MLASEGGRVLYIHTLVKKGVGAWRTGHHTRAQEHIKYGITRQDLPQPCPSSTAIYCHMAVSQASACQTLTDVGVVVGSCSEKEQEARSEEGKASRAGQKTRVEEDNPNVGYGGSLPCTIRVSHLSSTSSAVVLTL